MDQLKIIIKKIRKFGFWVFFGISLILTMLIWNMVVGSLTNTRDERTRKIDSSFKEMGAITSQANLPTGSVVTQKKIEVKEQSKNVFASWETFYAHQKKYNVWPITDVKYVDEFKTAGEKKYKSGRYYRIEDIAREHYWDRIKVYVKELKKKYDIKRPKENLVLDGSAGTGIRTAGAGPSTVRVSDLRDDQMDGTIFWNDANFQFLERRLSWKVRPETEEVIVGQEDLWVYEALLRIIQKTNEGWSEFSVPIKEIVEIAIAQDALKGFDDAAERIVDLKSLETFRMAAGMGQGGEGMSAQDAYAKTTEEVTLTRQEKMELQLYDERYVDRSGNPLTAQDFKEKPPAVEYKMLPIRMSLVINQRFIGDLLVHCANSSMPVEVRQLSFNPGMGKKFNLTDEEAETSRRSTGAILPRTGRRDRSTEPSAYASRTAEDEAQPLETTRRDTRYLSVMGPEDVELELLGMIYIFNPPETSKMPSLKEENEAETSAGDTSEDDAQENADASSSSGTSRRPAAAPDRESVPAENPRRPAAEAVTEPSSEEQEDEISEEEGISEEEEPVEEEEEPVDEE